MVSFMQLETSSWADIEAVAPTTALVPAGSTEQHSPHAPVGTDTIIARADGRRGRSGVGWRISCAPSAAGRRRALS
ncbi:creatininase family protein [Natronorubrum sp. FCH18a]|uniref:creatininase family protein n=1 Tax=Natronorubrum sp. FCH18a TaxID=3447018 RepID=UPI003F510354